MDTRLFNVLQKLRAAKDLVTSEGPDILRRVADALDRTAEGARRVAEFLQQQRNSPAVSFATPELAAHVDGIAQLRDECHEAARGSATVGTAAETQQSPGAEARTCCCLTIAALCDEVLAACGGGGPQNGGGSGGQTNARPPVGQQPQQPAGQQARPTTKSPPPQQTTPQQRQNPADGV